MCFPASATALDPAVGHQGNPLAADLVLLGGDPFGGTPGRESVDESHGSPGTEDLDGDQAAVLHHHLVRPRPGLRQSGELLRARIHFRLERYAIYHARHLPLGAGILLLSLPVLGSTFHMSRL